MNDKLIRKVNEFQDYHYRSYTLHYQKYGIILNVYPKYLKNMPDILFHYYEYYTYI